MNIWYVQVCVSVFCMCVDCCRRCMRCATWPSLTALARLCAEAAPSRWPPGTPVCSTFIYVLYVN